MTPQEFFKKVQNKIHYAIHGQTAAEVIYSRADAEKEFMGLTTFAGSQPTLKEAVVVGALFTLADLALAAAANSHGTLAFSLSSNITFLRSSGPGDTLYAEARERYAGRSTGYYQIDITNQKGELVATFESSVFRKGDALPFAVPL